MKKLLLTAAAALVCLGAWALENKLPLMPIGDPAVMRLFKHLSMLLEGAPREGAEHIIAFEVVTRRNDRIQGAGKVHFTVTPGKFRLILRDGQGAVEVKNFAIGQNTSPWVSSPDGTLFAGENTSLTMHSVIPEVLGAYQQSVLQVLTMTAQTGSLEIFRNLLKIQCGIAGKNKDNFYANHQDFSLKILMNSRSKKPEKVEITLKDGSRTEINFTTFELNKPYNANDFDPPVATGAVKKVEGTLLVNALRPALEHLCNRVFKLEPPGDGLCTVDREIWSGKGLRIDRAGNFPILIFSGTPEEIGSQHGVLCRDEIRQTHRCATLIAGTYIFMKNRWFYDVIKEIEQRAGEFTPERYLTELDAMSQAAGLTAKQGREIGFFPELFHCSGIAVRGKASVDGQVIHARVLDYMRDLGLSSTGNIQIYLPENYNAFLSVSFAGFNGTVTAMNEKGLAMGEMGGRGDNRWDGLPMSYLMRRIMEECSSVEEAKKLIAENPLTCEYYYVLSDRSGNMTAVETQAGQPPVFLAPGEEYSKLLKSFEDIVWITAPPRQEVLSKRLQQHYGKIDTEIMKEIIKRPVAMSSNLHNAIFLPETLDVHFSYSSGNTLGCDNTYYKINLQELIDHYRAALKKRQ